MKYPNRIAGELHERKYKAKFKVSKLTKRTCTMCGGRVRRSWVTHILHTRCRTCRYLVMMYGPSIEVTYIGD
jgi:hypothetical protein